MSKMVSARIPDALYEQGSLQLEAVGATISELITSAFEYLLKERALPDVAGAPVSQPRVLSKEQAARLRRTFQNCTLHIDIPTDVSYDKQTARAARESRHETAA